MADDPKTPLLTSKDDTKQNDGSQGLDQNASSKEDLKEQAEGLPEGILVTNPAKVKTNLLLNILHKRFTREYEKWKRMVKLFGIARITILFLILVIQLTQVILLQIPEISDNAKKRIATVLPSLTGSLVAMKLKLGYSEKAAKSKQSAKVYKNLVTNVEYRMKMEESGGVMSNDDIIKLWNSALSSETKDVSAFQPGY